MKPKMKHIALVFALLSAAFVCMLFSSCTTITTPLVDALGKPILGPDGKVLVTTVKSTDSAAVQAFGSLGIQAANLALSHSGK